jgi:ABC-type transport system involved in cytochrome c biogenesis permease subunit
VRYRGETFYQSEYNSMRQNGQVVETTGLQVVANQGWIIPYVACMLVLFGMLAHFIGVFFRFANRFERGAIPTAESIGFQHAAPPRRVWMTAAPLALLIIGMVGYAAMPPRKSPDAIDWYAVGKIPAMHEGRPKPLDTVARNVLQQIGEPLFGATPRPKDIASGQRRSGTAWLISLMADKEWPADAPVFRVYSQEARDYFDLKPKAGYLYSYNELQPKAEELRKRLAASEKLTPEEEKLAHVLRKLQLYDSIAYSYRLPPLPDESQFKDTEEDRRRFGSQLMNLMEYERQLEASNPPAVIPPEASEKGQPIADDRWQAYSPAIFTNYVTQKLGMRSGGANPAILKFTEVLDAVRDNDSHKVNRAVDDYLAYVNGLPAVEKKISGVPVEAWLNHFSPTTWGVALYLVAFVVGMVGMLWFSPAVRWSTFTIILLTLIVHTIAIVSRIYVSGRPPVVNLYSSAVFIGWASVLFALILELIYPLGICNIAAALIGASTLSIARSLDSSDTMHVLEAVLDTQFWLSTHVITVTLGYGATFLAGLFGIIALVHRMASGIDRGAKVISSQKEKDDASIQTMLTRIIYGILCFAILFSFIGTVLGGLWADDSWGRFWGWDPKENGALMIVLWNALVLHANWDRMVGQRGLAVLAVLGNIVTSWSWFGTNQLGIGLHSYGFTSAVLVTLALVVVGHVTFVIVSLMLTRPQTKVAA